MQNATPSQIKMLLTRLGEGSKIVVTGDVKQADRNNQQNGLLNFDTITNGKEMKFIRTCRFTNKDIERHPAVAEVLSLYGDN